MNRKLTVLLQLAVLLLALGTVACAAESVTAHEEDTENATPAKATPAVPAAVEPAPAEANLADWTTTLNVKLALLEKLGADSLHVDVTTVSGASTLAGTVEKRETKELAETIAKSVDAVESVENNIRLEANLDNPSQAGVAAGEAEAELKDAMLSTKLRLAMVNKMGSDGFRIGTEVANGVVTLEFDHDFATERRQEAVKVAEAVAGVTKVVSIDKHSTN